MNILYGVAGEGLGHAIRSKVVLEHLSKKHNIHILASRNSYKFLSNQFKNVHEIEGLYLSYSKNTVHVGRTIISNLVRLPGLWAKNLKVMRGLKNFKPDVVISDFESLSYIYAKKHGIPVICIDNNHILTRTKLKIKGFYSRMGRFVVRMRTPNCKKYFISAFFHLPPKKNAILTPPLLRDSIMKAKPKKGDHILVYQTSKSMHKLLLKVFSKLPEEKFVVYFNSGHIIKNVVFKRFSEKGFIEDLRTSKAVITNGGFQLITEALQLKKPVLSVPIKKQYEQELNATFLEKLGYGMMAKRFSEKTLRRFLDNLEKYSKKLKTYKQPDIKIFFKQLDKTLEEVWKTS